MEAKDQIALAVFLFVSLPTLGVSIGTLWLTSKSRNSIHRDQLYKKQIEAYEKIFEVLTPMHHECFACTWKPDGVFRSQDELPTAQDISRNIKNRVLDPGTYDQLIFCYQRTMFFLPSAFQKAMSAYINLVAQLGFAMGRREDDLFLQRELIQQDLDERYKAVIEAARHSLGAEKLSEEILTVLNSRNRVRP